MRLSPDGAKTKSNGTILQRVEELKNRLTTKTRRLTNEETQTVQKLRAEKYATGNWNFGSAPQFQFRNSRRFDWGKFELAFDVKQGVVTRAQIFGDFFATDDVASIIKVLIDAPFQKDDLAKRVTPELLRTTIPICRRRNFYASRLNSEFKSSRFLSESKSGLNEFSLKPLAI